jgi:hypothetical protein
MYGAKMLGMTFARPEFASFLYSALNLFLRLSDCRDHVPPPANQTAQIDKALGRQRDSPVPKDAHCTWFLTEAENHVPHVLVLRSLDKYNDNPASFWDRFYKWNEGNFFRDRKWLHQEFPELTGLTGRDVRAFMSDFRLPNRFQDRVATFKQLCLSDWLCPSTQTLRRLLLSPLIPLKA